MNNLENNKQIAYNVVKLVSDMFCLDDGVLVEFEPSSSFPDKDVTAMVTRDYRIKYNIDRLQLCPDYEVYISSFHEMRHIYQYCCIDFGYKEQFRRFFPEPLERIKIWGIEFRNYYFSAIENDVKYLGQDCEIDAMAFAFLMMKKIYQINIQIPSVVAERVKDRAKEIGIKYGLEF